MHHSTSGRKEVSIIVMSRRKQRGELLFALHKVHTSMIGDEAGELLWQLVAMERNAFCSWKMAKVLRNPGGMLDAVGE